MLECQARTFRTVKAWFRDIIKNTFKMQSMFSWGTHIFGKLDYFHQELVQRELFCWCWECWLRYTYIWKARLFSSRMGSKRTIFLLVFGVSKQNSLAWGKFSFETIIKNWFKTNYFACVGVSNQNSSDCESLVSRHHDKHFGNTIKVFLRYTYIWKARLFSSIISSKRTILLVLEVFLIEVRIY